MDGEKHIGNAIGFFSPSGMYKIRSSILSRLTLSCFPTLPVDLLQLFHQVNQLQPNSVDIYFLPLSSIYREVHFHCTSLHPLLLENTHHTGKINLSDISNHITLIVDGDLDQSAIFPLSLPVQTDNQFQQLAFACRSHSILRYYYGMYNTMYSAHVIEVTNGEPFLPMNHGRVHENCTFLQERSHLKSQTSDFFHYGHVLFVRVVFGCGFLYAIGDINNLSNLSIFLGQLLLPSSCLFLLDVLSTRRRNWVMFGLRWKMKMLSVKIERLWLLRWMNWRRFSPNRPGFTRMDIWKSNGLMGNL